MTTRIKLQTIREAAANRPPGYYEKVITAGIIEGDVLTIELDVWHAIAGTKNSNVVQKPSTPIPSSGPGTELKKLLVAIGIVGGPQCQCEARATEMDRQGIEWCEANEKTIVGWLREEAKRRRLPFTDLAGRALLRLAIRRARLAALRQPLRDAGAVTVRPSK